MRLCGDKGLGKPSFKNNSYFFVSKNGIRGRKEMEKSIGYFLTAPKSEQPARCRRVWTCLSTPC